ncbi:MAG: Rpn family recombination-promoting nuclease/putative transposase [Anaerovoracaceae bacterium]
MRKYKQNERIPFTDDLMFSLVVRDENICRQLLERILPDEQFGEIRIENAEDGLYVETQKSIKFPLGAHGVRLDAFIKTGNVWAEIELQTYTGDHIAKRSRYYQANMDLDFLNEGHKYRELPRSYVIFICTYDYIGADLPVYFFEKFDRQNCLQFGDEAYSIILNTACSSEKVPQPLKALFEYINDPTKCSGDALVEDIDRQVSRFNTDEWRRRHMTLQELMDRNYEQGLEQGRAEGESIGKEQMRFEMARSMKEDGEDAERIAKYTGLPIVEIKKL